MDKNESLTSKQTAS